MKTVSRIVLACLIASCTRVPKKLTAGTLFDLKPGTTTKDALARNAGIPLGKISEGNGEYWQFENINTPRLSVFFPAGSDVVESFTLFLEETDRERDLETALKSFPTAKWKIEPPDWVNPHIIPTECFYEDNGLGVSINYDSANQTVESISRWNPGRSLTSKKPSNDVRPQACIDGKCVDFISAEEWKKVSSWNVCPLPK